MDGIPNDAKINDTSFEIAFHPPIYLINNAVFLLKCHRTFGQPWTKLRPGVLFFSFLFFLSLSTCGEVEGVKEGNGIWMGNFTLFYPVVSVILGKIESLLFDIWILLILYFWNMWKSKKIIGEFELFRENYN